jgi:hypothetical protein
MVVSVVNRKLMRSGPVVFRKHKWNADIQCKLVRDSIVEILEKNKTTNVAYIDPLPLRAKVILYEVVLKGKCLRSFTFIRNPRLCKKNGRAQK